MIQRLQTVMEFPPKIPPLEWYLQFFTNNLRLEYWLWVLVQTVDEKWVHNLILTDLHRGSHAWVSDHLHNSHSIREGNGLSWLGIRIHSKAIKRKLSNTIIKQKTNHKWWQSIWPGTIRNNSPGEATFQDWKMDQTRNKDLFVIPSVRLHPSKPLDKKL